MELSLQLYTVREETARDFTGTLEKVAAIGYTGVEFAGYGNIPASEMKNTLDRLGLAAVGSHVGIARLKSNLEDEIAYNLEIGNKYIICPYNIYANREDYVNTARFLNEAGEKCLKNGLRLGYHNHAHEFQSFDGEYGLDILYKETNHEYLFAEIDICWVNRAGLDPAEYIKKYAGRCPLIHLKDRKDTEDICFAEVGDGIVDIPSVIKAGKESGAEYFIVEQDRSARLSLDSARISFENIKKMNLL